MGGFAWVTLATNDSYSLGALVLGHSLRRAGTPHDLVVLVTPGVSQTMRNQLSTVFTLVQEVNILDSKDEANLALLERPDLGITFTKLHCWRLTQYEKCVFLDADTLVLKNSDELFEREELSAAPDPGWPDCFNSGVFVYRPSQDTFNALVKFALAKGSFDGGDQGLLNMYFSDWATKDISKHLPFIYNMVSTATYSYLPAYKQFGESAKIVHFIGANKPWLQYFDSETKLARSPTGSEHMQPLLQLWWDIFCSTVHPSLSPDMADRSTFDQPAHAATPTVSHFIVDLFQKFQPMSIYSEYQPVSTTPYAEDPSLGFWDPWESYIEHVNDSSHNEQHIMPWDYHGSDQQKKAFIHDERQSGWKRHEVKHNEPQYHHEPQNHVHHHQHHVEHHHQPQPQHHYHEPQHHHQQHHEPKHHHHEPQHHHHHHQQHHEPQHHHHHHHHHHHEPQHQQHHEPQHQQHHEPQHQQHHEPQHHHHHEPQHQQHHEPQHQQHHEPQHQQHHEPQHQQHHEPQHQQHHEPQHQQHHEPQHQQHHHHEPHHHQSQHYHHEPKHHQQHESHHQSHHQHHEPHHHYQHHEPHHHHQHHDHHQEAHHQHHEHHHHHNHPESHHHHEQPPQHHNEKPHEEYQIYNVPPPPWESHNKHEHRDESHGHNHHPDPSSTSQANSNINSQYVKVANETEYSVDEPPTEDETSTAADDGLGLAGALAQLTLGVPRTTEQTVFEEHMRRQAWEQGTMDYMGRDSFDNIWRKITDTLAQAPTKPATEEVPPTQPASEPKLPESIPPAPKSRKSPPADTSEAPGLSSSAEPTSNQSSQVTETPPEGKSIEPSPLSSTDITPPKSAPEQAIVVPHTPSIIEATPPTSPPIVIPTAPIADIQALKVNAPQPETPPVGSSPSELGSDTQLKTAQTIESHEQALPTSKDSNLQQSTPVPEQSTLAEKKVSSDTLESLQTSSQEVPALKEITSSLVSTPGEVPASSAIKETPIVSSDSQIPSTQDTSIKGDASVPMKEVMDKTEGQKDTSVSPLVHKTEISISQSTDATQVPSSGGIEVKSSAEQIGPISQPTDEAKVPSVGATDVQPVVGKEVPAHEIASAATEVKLVLEKEVTIPQQVVGSQIPSEMKHATDEVAVSQKVLEPPIPASPITEVKPATVVPTEPSTPSSPISEVKPATVVPITQQVVEPPTPASPLTEVKPAIVVPTTQQVVEPPTPASPLTEVKPATVIPTTQQVVEPPTPASPLTEVKPATVVPTTQQVVEPPTPASPLTEVKPATVVPTTQQVVEPPTPASPLTEVKPATVVPTTQQVVEPQIPISAVTEVKLPEKKIPVSPTAQKVQAPVSPPPSSNQTQDSKSQSSENIVPEDPKAQSVPAQVVKTKEEVKSAGKKPSIELKTASVESTQSEQVPKSPSSKSSAPGSAPSTPDVAPPDQAPIPPKRRGHKGAGAAAASEQGAASKPATQSQTQQTKGSKGQKGKK